MKRTHIAAFAAIALLVVAGAGYAAYSRYRNPEVEIYGLRVGMPAEDYKQLARLYEYRPFQLGNLTATSTPEATFRDGKLDTFTMEFGRYSYDNFRELVRAKYPSMKCEKAQGKDANGQDVQFERCRVGKTFLLASGWVSSSPSQAMMFLQSDRAHDDLQRQNELYEKTHANKP